MFNKKIIRSVFISLSVFQAVSVFGADKQDRDQVASASINENKSTNSLWYKQAAKGFEQSLPLGNGRLGAMVFGDTNEERIVINEESVWSGSKVENNIPGGHKHLAKIRKLLGEENFIEANKLMKQAFKVKNAPKYAKGISAFGRYQVLGNIHLKFLGNKAKVSQYKRELDLNSALAKINYQCGKQSFTREHFVSAHDEVFVSRFSGPVSFSISMDRPERFKTTAVNKHELLMTGSLNDGFGKDGLTYAARLRVVAPGASIKVDGNKLIVESKDEVLLLLAAATDYRGIAGRQLSDPLAATRQDLDKAEKKSFIDLRKAQKADHEKYFKRVSLELPKTKISSFATDERLKLSKQGKQDPSLA